MKVIVVGATGTIGSSVVDALADHHDVIRVGHSRGDLNIDLADSDSMREMYHKASPFDAVVSAAGPAAFRPFEDIADDDFRQALTRKLMGQVNLVRLGMERINDNGSFTLTSGVLGRHPAPGSVVASTVNAAIEGFVRAAGTEMPRGVRLNAVSPVWVKETMEGMGLVPRPGVSAADTARAYVEAVEGSSGAEVLEVPDFV